MPASGLIRYYKAAAARINVLQKQPVAWFMFDEGPAGDWAVFVSDQHGVKKKSVRRSRLWAVS